VPINVKLRVRFRAFVVERVAAAPNQPLRSRFGWRERREYFDVEIDSR